MAYGRRFYSNYCGMFSAVAIAFDTYHAADAFEPDLRSSMDVFTGYDAGNPIIGAGLFAPLFQSSNSVFFMDGSLSASVTGFNSASLGLGYRRQQSWGVFGVNGFLDLGNTHHSGVITQLGLGAELASGAFRLGVNGYFPVEDKETAMEASEAHIVGNELLIFGGEEHFLRGADIELGVLALELQSEQYSAQLWANGGAGMYHSDDLGNHINAHLGMEAVLQPFGELFANSELRAGAGISIEDENIAFNASFKVSMALGGNPLHNRAGRDAETDLLTNRVKRQIGIASRSAATGGSELTFDHDTNVALDLAYIADNQSDLILALGSTNTITVVDGSQTSFTGIVVEEDRTVVGGNSTIKVRGRQTGTVVDFHAPGATPTINVAGPFATGINISGNNTHIAGFNINGDAVNSLFLGTSGIAISQAQTNIVLEQNYIQNSASGISVAPFGRDFIFRNNRIETAVIALNMGSNLHNVLIEGNQIGNLVQTNFNTDGNAIAINYGTGAQSAVEPIIVQDNFFFGLIPESIISVGGAGYTLAGDRNVSTSLVSSALNAAMTPLCTKSSAAAFGGSVGFVSGTVRDLSPTQCF